MTAFFWRGLKYRVKEDKRVRVGHIVFDYKVARIHPDSTLLELVGNYPDLQWDLVPKEQRDDNEEQ